MKEGRESILALLRSPSEAMIEAVVETIWPFGDDDVPRSILLTDARNAIGALAAAIEAEMR